jgi:glyoxylase-like metal-dependent hydrolase (beta-lactamase superfamily II)
MARGNVSVGGCTRIAAFAALACLATTAQSQSTQSPATQELVLVPQQIAKDVYVLLGSGEPPSHENRGFVSNAGFVVTGAGVVVFDALGSPVLGDAMIRAIRRVTGEPIRRLIISHYHADHFYGAGNFQRIGAQVWANRRGREYLSSPIAQARFNQRVAELGADVPAEMRLTEADRWLNLDRGRRVRFAMGRYHFVIIGASGHSVDGITMMVEEVGVLFAGDAVFLGRVPYVGDADTLQWLETLVAIDGLHASVVVPGHGAVTAGSNCTAPTRSYLVFLRRVMGEAANNLDDFDEAYQQTDWGPFEHWPAFNRINRLNAYGVYLQMQNTALQQERRLNR